MYYPLRITKQGPDLYHLTCRDLPGCVIEENSFEKILAASPQIFRTCMELHYRRQKRVIPMPSELQEEETPLYVPLRIQAKILLWNHIASRGLKITEVAQMLGLSRDQVRRLVDLSESRANLEAIENALVALNAHFTMRTDGDPL